MGPTRTVNGSLRFQMRGSIAVEAGHYAGRMSAFGGSISKRRLLSIEGTAPVIGKTLFDVLLPVAASRAHH